MQLLPYSLFITYLLCVGTTTSLRVNSDLDLQFFLLPSPMHRQVGEENPGMRELRAKHSKQPNSFGELQMGSSSVESLVLVEERGTETGRDGTRELSRPQSVDILGHPQVTCTLAFPYRLIIPFP